MPIENLLTIQNAEGRSAPIMQFYDGFKAGIAYRRWLATVKGVSIVS